MGICLFWCILSQKGLFWYRKGLLPDQKKIFRSNHLKKIDSAPMAVLVRFGPFWSDDGPHPNDRYSLLIRFNVDTVKPV